MNRLLITLYGILLSFLGIGIVIKPKFYYSKFDYYVDFTGIKWPIGIMLVIFGLYCFKSSMKENENSNRYLICPKCRKLYDIFIFSNKICGKCNIELENLKGFYDRHPELRDNKK